MHVLLYVLFFFSGASGLIYQVIWVREFGNVFGNTIYSASLVIAVFMSGLGIGSYAAGVWADRRYSAASGFLLRGYGYCEFAIAAAGFLVSTLLPHLGTLSVAISSYTHGTNGWYYLSTPAYLARYVVAVFMLAPITTLMGGTLTLLIRHLVRRDLAAAGWKVGALYGINTAGAAAGAFFTDHAFVPAIGLHATQMVAVLLNLIAAFGALWLASRWSPDTARLDVAETSPSRGGAAADVASGTLPRPVVLTGVAIFLSGFAAMGMEIVWFRHIETLLGSARSVFSLALTVILVGMWLGAVAGGSANRRFGRPVMLYILAQALFLLSMLLGLAAADIKQIYAATSAAGTAFFATTGWRRATIELWLNVRPVLAEVLAPALFMGATFPLANAIIQHAEGAVGRRAGVMYFANTVGAVFGALAGGFVLLPRFGMQQSATILGSAAALAIVPLYFVARSMPAWGGRLRPIKLVAGASLIAAGIAMALWISLPPSYLIARTLWPMVPNERSIAVREGVTEILAIRETPGGDRLLITNGFAMSATNLPYQRQMRAFAHIPLLSLEAPDRVLVICFGVGNTARAASLHPSVRRLEIADLSELILEHAHHFAATNGNVLRDPKVSVYVNDGRHHLRMQPEATYDLITLEPPPIANAGVSALYSREFYQLVRSRLKPKGYVTQWLPVYQVPAATNLALVRAFIEVFPQAVLLSSLGKELLLMGVNDARLEIDPGLVQARLRSAPAVQADMDKINLGTLTTILGTFVASAPTLALATKSSFPVTDDYPIPEFAVKSRLEHHRAPSQLFDVTTVAAWCPTCFLNGKPRPGLEDLTAYLTILGRVYQDPHFLEHRSVVGTDGRRVTLRVDPVAEKVIAENPYLQFLLRSVYKL